LIVFFGDVMKWLLQIAMAYTPQIVISVIAVGMFVMVGSWIADRGGN
jgi:hypothetical protein